MLEDAREGGGGAKRALPQKDHTAQGAARQATAA